MARQPLRQTRATTTVNTTAPTRRLALATRDQQTPAFARITSADVSDPVRLARVISDLQTSLTAMQSASRTNPLNAGGIVLQNVAFTSGVAKLLVHNLRRAPRGYHVMRTSSGAAAISVFESTLPTGYDASRAINLTPSATGTADVFVY